MFLTIVLSGILLVYPLVFCVFFENKTVMCKDPTMVELIILAIFTHYFNINISFCSHSIVLTVIFVYRYNSFVMGRAIALIIAMKMNRYV